jgi:hypothetical protein
MAAPRGAAHDPLALLAEAEWWRDRLDGDETIPLAVAWAAWRWADAARQLIADSGRQRHATAVITLLAHARILLDLLDAGRLDAAVRYHERATYGAEVLNAAALAEDRAFLAWAARHDGGRRRGLFAWRGRSGH